MNNIRDLILLAIYKSGGDGIKGRTKLQKILYLYSIKKDIELGYEPYFYGPYSEDVTVELTRLITDGTILEKNVSFNNTGNDSKFEKVLYTYELSEKAKKDLSELEQRMEDESRILEDLINGIDSSTIEVIAVATKIKYFINKKGRISIDEIPSEAQKYGWKIDPNTIFKAIELLKNLNMARVN